MAWTVAARRAADALIDSLTLEPWQAGEPHAPQRCGLETPKPARSHLALKLGAIWLALADCLSGPALAESYPERDITLIVPFSRGGDTDLAARALQPHVQNHFAKITVRLDHREGESGAVATRHLIQSPADGYTLMVGRVSNLAIVPVLDTRASYSAKDMSVIAMISINPLVCSVRRDAAFSKPRDLINYMRANPGKLRYGTAGAMTIHHLSVLYLLRISGLKSEHATAKPYPNGADAVAALMEGSVDLVCGNPATVLPALRDKRLQALFTTASARIPALPEVPTAQEVGLRDMQRMLGWVALVGPAHLPEPAVQSLRQVIEQAVSDPQWLASEERAGAIRIPRSVRQPEKFIKDQVEFYDELAGSMGLRK